MRTYITNNYNAPLFSKNVYSLFLGTSNLIKNVPRNVHDMGTKEEVKPNFRTPPR
jgi:hypothetical protein